MSGLWGGGNVLPLDLGTGCTGARVPGCIQNGRGAVSFRLQTRAHVIILIRYITDSDANKRSRGRARQPEAVRASDFCKCPSVPLTL